MLVSSPTTELSGLGQWSDVNIWSILLDLIPLLAYFLQSFLGCMFATSNNTPIF